MLIGLAPHVGTPLKQGNQDCAPETQMDCQAMGRLGWSRDGGLAGRTSHGRDLDG